MELLEICDFATLSLSTLESENNVFRGVYIYVQTWGYRK